MFKLIIKDDNQKTVYQHTLKLKQVEKLACSSKTFKVENACVSDDFMRLGYLTSTDEDFIEEISKYFIRISLFKK